MDSKTSIFQNKIPKQHFSFFSDPSPIDIQSLQASHGKATFSVLTTGPVCQPSVQPSQDPPGGGSGGEGPTGPSPGSTAPTRAAQVSQPTQPSGDKTAKGFSLRNLSMKLKSLIYKPRILPKFSSLATLIISLSLLAKPGDTAEIGPLGSADASNFLRRNARNASVLTMRTGFDSLPTAGWAPSNSTAVSLTRKGGFLFTMSAMSATLSMLTDPEFLHKCNALADDPDSKALLNLQLCDSCAERSADAKVASG